jgi:superfamily II DNA or RNA helicase
MTMNKPDLYKHQSEAVDFALKNNGKCALFHDPGLGKTRTCLEIFSRYKAVNPNLRLLVVCPLSLVNSAWGEDIKRFTDFTYAPFKELKDKLPATGQIERRDEK